MREQRVKNPEELVADYKNGMSVRRLSEKYNLSEGGVYYYLRVYNAKRDRYEKQKQKEKKKTDIEARKKKLRARRKELMKFIEDVMINVD